MGNASTHFHTTLDDNRSKFICHSPKQSSFYYVMASTKFKLFRLFNNDESDRVEL